jgi:hypothetical protein
VKEVWSACDAVAVARGKDGGDASAEWVRFDDALNRLEEQFEALEHAARDFLNYCAEFSQDTSTAHYVARFRALEAELDRAASNPAKRLS